MNWMRIDLKISQGKKLVVHLTSSRQEPCLRQLTIATISPADINYEETLSTLRYADRAKQIRTQAIVNEDPTEMMVRELREENLRLKKMLERGVVDIPVSPSMAPEEVEKLRAKWEEEMQAAMAENEREIRQIKQTYEEKLQSAKLQHDKVDVVAAQHLEEARKKQPHLSNLNFDPQLTGKIFHILEPGENVVGKGESCDIVILGPSIQERHALLAVHPTYGGVTVDRAVPEARVLVNGDPVVEKVPLTHNDRLLFGTTQLYIFKHPGHTPPPAARDLEVTYEMAMEEIATKAGSMSLDPSDQSTETALLHKDLLEVLPGIGEANAIAEELNKKVRFEIQLVAPQFAGGPESPDRTQVYVRMFTLDSQLEFFWPKEKFLNRLFVMKEMFLSYESGEDWEVTPERDPFLEDPEISVKIGIAQVYLQPLAYRVEIKEQLEVVDIRGSQVGLINVEVVPCSPQGAEFSETDDMFVDTPTEMIGTDLHLVVKITNCLGLPPKFTDIYCQYRVYLDQESTVTETISSTSNPTFNHRRLFSFIPVTSQVSPPFPRYLLHSLGTSFIPQCANQMWFQVLEYLKEGVLQVEVWGRQVAGKTAVDFLNSSKGRFQEDLMTHASTLMNGFRLDGRDVDPSKQSVIVELLLMKKQQARLHQRLGNIRRLVEEAERNHKTHVPVSAVREVLSTSLPELAEDVIREQVAGDTALRNGKKTDVISKKLNSNHFIRELWKTYYKINIFKQKHIYEKGISLSCN
ncbi:hypothetical protein LAZ67_5000734 [Cordylochernes scorpioides]|uniref:Kinesin motor domain-containing protein n=1 Tax=Cordylochernes scorpioides TaxID=51811 RepID=A0ABY6KH01_9ARAC|nr:hypothetical protein LAZ67_5000734 [Cordylochernes scorpioides]